MIHEIRDEFIYPNIGVRCRASIGEQHIADYTFMLSGIHDIELSKDDILDQLLRLQYNIENLITNIKSFEKHVTTLHDFWNTHNL